MDKPILSILQRAKIKHRPTDATKMKTRGKFPTGYMKELAAMKYIVG
jgi:hypothetical protein